MLSFNQNVFRMIGIRIILTIRSSALFQKTNKLLSLIVRLNLPVKTGYHIQARSTLSTGGDMI